MLSEANARTKAKKEAADTMEGVTVIAPTIQRMSHDNSISHVIITWFYYYYYYFSIWDFTESSSSRLLQGVGSGHVSFTRPPPRLFSWEQVDPSTDGHPEERDEQLWVHDSQLQTCRLLWCGQGWTSRGLSDANSIRNQSLNNPRHHSLPRSPTRPPLPPPQKKKKFCR